MFYYDLNFEIVNETHFTARKSVVMQHFARIRMNLNFNQDFTVLSGFILFTFGIMLEFAFLKVPKRFAYQKYLCVSFGVPDKTGSRICMILFSSLSNLLFKFQNPGPLVISFYHCSDTKTSYRWSGIIKLSMSLYGHTCLDVLLSEWNQF